MKIQKKTSTPRSRVLRGRQEVLGDFSASSTPSAPLRLKIYILLVPEDVPFLVEGGMAARTDIG
jgi:hypothetical protein